MADPTPSNLTWRKSYSSGISDSAIEVAVTEHEVLVRSSRDPSGAVLRLSYRQWMDFVTRVGQRKLVQYEIVLGPSAMRTMNGLAEGGREKLENALKNELEGGPHSDKRITFEVGRKSYTAIPLSFKAYTAICRPLTDEELARLFEDSARITTDHGYFVIDILPAEYAWARTSRHRDRLAHARSEAAEGEVQPLSEDDLDSLFRN